MDYPFRLPLPKVPFPLTFRRLQIAFSSARLAGVILFDGLPGFDRRRFWRRMRASDLAMRLRSIVHRLSGERPVFLRRFHGRDGVAAAVADGVDETHPTVAVFGVTEKRSVLNGSVHF